MIGYEKGARGSKEIWQIPSAAFPGLVRDVICACGRARDRTHSTHVRLTAVERHTHTEAYSKRLSEMSALTSSFVGQSRSPWILHLSKRDVR